MTRGARTMRRLLVVAGHEPWPLNSGGRLRLYHFLKWLSHRADVTLVLPGAAQCAAHLPERLRLVDASAAHRSSAAAAGPRRARILCWARRHFGWRPALAAWLRQFADRTNFDAALLSGAVTGQYVADVHVPAVWDPVDELVLYTSRAGQGQGLRARLGGVCRMPLYAAFERHVARRVRATVFSSPIDAGYARRWAGGARIEALTNGVDLGYFCPHRPEADAPRCGPAEEPTPNTVAFIGSLSFPPNVDAVLWFTQRVWPRLYREGPGRRLLIVGRAPPIAVRAVARHPGVELHGDVPDVRPYLARAAVVVVPTRQGGGVKNKILEACAMGRPVVASPRALGGLSARHGHDLLCAAHDEAWVRQVSRLLTIPQLARDIGQRGYEWVRRTHAWPRLAERLYELLDPGIRLHPSHRLQTGATGRDRLQTGATGRANAGTDREPAGEAPAATASACPLPRPSMGACSQGELEALCL